MGAVPLLVGAKLTTVYIPLIYKHAIDALSAKAGAIVLPLGLLLAYGGARILAATFSELREIAFARVAQNAIHVVALETFRHLHRAVAALPSRAPDRRPVARHRARHQRHRQPAALPAVPDLPDAVRDPAGRGGPVGPLRLLVRGDHRRDHRRLYRLHARHHASGGFNSAARCSRRKARPTPRPSTACSTTRRSSISATRTTRRGASTGRWPLYEKRRIKSANRSRSSTPARALIIAIGVTAVMILAADGVADGRMTLGDFVLVNAYLIQLYMPLNFLGMVYRELQPGDDRHAGDVPAARRQCRGAGLAGAAPLRVEGGRVEFENVDFGYDTAPADPEGLSFTVPAGKTVAIVGPSGAGKSTISRLLFRFYDVEAAPCASTARTSAT